MANKSMLSKNYYIDSVVVTDFGADVYNVMAEADRAMEEASEIIAEIASLTERVPSEIRCGALQEGDSTGGNKERGFPVLWTEGRSGSAEPAGP